MFALLSVEWLKIKRYRTFWILSGLFAALLFLSNWLYSRGLLKLGPAAQILDSNYTFPNVWVNVAYFTKLFTGLIAIIVTIITTNEYQFRTNRQNVIDGWKRLDFFHAKWLFVLVLSLAVTLYSFLIGLFFGIFNGSSLANAGGQLEKMLYVFILTLNYFGFALTLSFLIRRSGMTIIIFLVYTYIAEMIMYFYINDKVSGKPADFLPMESAARLLTVPFGGMAKQMMGDMPKASGTLIMVSLAWTAVYYTAGRMRLQRSDW